MSAKMSLAGKKAALSKIEEFANSSDPKLQAKYGPKARALEAEIAKILEANPELARVRSARKGGNGSTANPRRTMAAKVAWITMNKRKLSETSDADEQLKLQNAIAELEDDITQIRRLFPEVDTPLGRGGAEIVDREATMSLFAQFADEFDEAMQRIMGLVPAAPVVPQEPRQITFVPAPAEPVADIVEPLVIEGVAEVVVEESAQQPANAKSRREQRRQQQKKAA